MAALSGQVRADEVLGLSLAGDGCAVVEAGRVIHLADDAAAARAWRAAELQHRHRCAVNLVGPTLGGKQWWTDRFIADGWRIQEHAVTRHSRLLDRRGLRQAWGSYAACRSHWERLLTQGRAQHLRGEVILLVHGLGRTRSMWHGLAKVLRTAGYQVLTLTWASTRSDIDLSARHLHGLLADLPGVSRVHLITHSLGGPLLRQTLALGPSGVDIASVMMCFPPNQGADLADLLAPQPLLRLVLGSSLPRLTHGQAGRWAPWPTHIPLRIIAGTAGRNPLIDGADDWVLGVDDTRLDGHEPVQLPVTHTFGINNSTLHAEVLTWLQAHRAQGIDAKLLTDSQ